MKYDDLSVISLGTVSILWRSFWNTFSSLWYFVFASNYNIVFSHALEHLLTQSSSWSVRLPNRFISYCTTTKSYLPSLSCLQRPWYCSRFLVSNTRIWRQLFLNKNFSLLISRYFIIYKVTFFSLPKLLCRASNQSVLSSKYHKPFFLCPFRRLRPK